MFDLSVAEVAGFSGVRGVGWYCLWLTCPYGSRSSRDFGGTGGPMVLFVVDLSDVFLKVYCDLLFCNGVFIGIIEGDP